MWTSERTEELKRQWLAGRTGAAIAAEMGVSRNAILGKVHRLNLPSDNHTTKGRSGGRRRTFDHDAALDMWAAGATAKTIAAKLGIRLGTVFSAVCAARKRGDSRVGQSRQGGPPSLPQEIRQAIVDAYRPRPTQAELAKMYGISQWTVSNIIRRAKRA